MGKDIDERSPSFWIILLENSFTLFICGIDIKCFFCFCATLQELVLNHILHFLLAAVTLPQQELLLFLFWSSPSGFINGWRGYT